MSQSVKIAVVGLGDVSLQIAHDLKSAGADVVGFDAVKPKYSPIPLAESLESAVAAADLVISLTSTAASFITAEAAAKALSPEAIFADLNPGTPTLKRKLGALFPAEAFADVAVMQDSLAASGAGAARFVELLNRFGLKVDYVSAAPGEAAARGLIRLLFETGLSSVLADTLWAAKSLGLEDWALGELKHAFAESSGETVQQHLNDTGKHAKLRSVQLGAVVEMLTESGHESAILNGISLTMSHVMHGRRVPFADLSGS